MTARPCRCRPVGARQDPFGHRSVHSSGLDALELRQGRLPGLRALSLWCCWHGIPCRCVSGYLHLKRDAKPGGKTVSRRSHAWVQAWTGGWWHYDPTNDNEITEQYISVGVGAFTPTEAARKTNKTRCA